MAMDELAHLPAGRLGPLIESRRVSPVEVVQAVLDRIVRFNDTLNSYLTVMDEEALQSARELEKLAQSGTYLGPLHGIPVALKDNIKTRGTPTTAGSRVLQDYVPDEDATIVARLRDAGAVIIGKTNLSEFAGGPTVFGDMRNPWNLEYLTGASSGGSGSAVAASLATAAMGHDTGGSVRLPAAWSGVVGLRQTYGRASRYGVLPHNWDGDVVGPITKTVEDAAHVLRVLAGPDPKDPTAADVPVPDYAAALAGGIRGLRLGIPKEWFFDVVDPEVKAAVEEGIRVLEGLGAAAEEVSIPHAVYTLEMGLTIQIAQMSAVHERMLKEAPEKYGPMLLLILQAGRLITAADYLKAQRLRALLKEDLRRAFARVDVVVTPTTPALPTLLADIARPLEHRNIIDGKEVEWSYATGGFTWPFSMTGSPAISVPCGFSILGLPIGMQIAGKGFDESTVLRVAHTYEAHTDWHTKEPPL